MAFSEGNVIQLNDARIGVVEACSGLSMLITFIALSTGMAIVVKRPLLDKIVLVMSAIPVALVANIARITLTGHPPRDGRGERRGSISTTTWRAG